MLALWLEVLLHVGVFAWLWAAVLGQRTGGGCGSRYEGRSWVMF